MGYALDFQAAKIFSTDIGLYVPDWLESTDLIFENQTKHAELHRIMMSLLGDPPVLARLATQCLPVHAALIQTVANIVGVMPALTIGCVTSADGDRWFSVTEPEIRRWCATGIENPLSLKLHAWLTLPTMEIVDFTFLPTFAITQAQPGSSAKVVEFGVIAKHADALTGMTYTPVAVGNDIPRKLKFPHMLIF